MSSKIAIIGYSFRFPNTDKSRFWQDLLEGRNLVTQVDPERWAHETYCHPDKGHPGTSYTFAAGTLGDVSKFDAAFFGISPREAAHIDPQQRLLLEMAWETFEHAGIRPSSIKGSSCGVFVGVSAVEYGSRYADDLGAVESSTATGCTSSIAANRLSYFFDLHGPSMAIDTACSSSLIAFHQACRSILSGEIDQALTGGISLHFHPFGFITFAKASMLSPRGRCSAFDAAGDGYVRAEGGGLFLLKNFDQAVADGDRILALVASSVVNTDGHKSGMTVPSAAVQGDLLRRAYAQAGIHPDDIDYIEAHGTGTPVGDPIESLALGTALGQRRTPGNPLPIGSVKSNLGHLEPAAGVAGLVKSLLCIEHRVVPATAGVTTLNPTIPFDDLNLAVVKEQRLLKNPGEIIIGVNSFGFGGANAHVVLQSAEPVSTTTTVARQNEPVPLLVTAKDENALKAAAGNLAQHLWDTPDLHAYDVAYHAAFRRERLKHRAVLFGTNRTCFAEALQAFTRGEPAMAVATGTALENPRGPVFVYSGNGSQWYGMGRNLLSHPLFKTIVEEIDALFRNYADWSIATALAGKDGIDRYEFTEIAQPALFAIQVGMTRMLEAYGIRPAAVIGHSVGEIAAAWACGSLTLEAAVRVIYYRSQLQGTTKGLGQMTAAGIGAPDATALLDELELDQVLSLAGSNSPKGVTFAGPPEPLRRLEAAMAERGVFNRRLGLDYAFHSPAMDPLEAGLLETLAGLPVQPTRIPFYSTVTGGILEGTALGADYWWHNIRKPVEFEPAIRQIIADGLNVFVEIGPHAILRGYINDCLRATDGVGRVITTGNRGQDDPQLVEVAAGQAMISGVDVDWNRFFPQPGNFTDLPYYPWQRERHWHPITPEAYGLLYRHKQHPLLGYPLPQQELAWENQLDTLVLPSLADHVVDGATVFPGAGFTEMALAAANRWAPGGLIEIEDLEIRSPLLLSNNRSKTVRLAIDPDDGRFAINSRDVGGHEDWNLNVTGRIIKEPSALALQGMRAALPPRQPDFDAQSHYRLTTAVGLSYGPAYQTIVRGWIEGQSVSAVLHINPTLDRELSEYHLHPTLLDGSFQMAFQLLRELLAEDTDSLFVPVRIGRVVLHDGCNTPYSAIATLLRRSPHSLTLKFTIHDAMGNLLAAMDQVRFRAIRIKRQPRHDRPDFLEYRAIPAPHIRESTPSCLDLAGCQTLLTTALYEAGVKAADSPYADEVEPLLDALCGHFALEFFRRLSGQEGMLSAETIRALKDRRPGLSAFIDHLLTITAEDGLLETGTSGFRLVSAEDEPVTAQDIWNSLVSDYPNCFHLTQSIAKTGLYLDELLEESPAAHLKPFAASMPQLAMQILGDTGSGIDLALRHILTAAQGDLQEGRRLRVLEISEAAPLAATVAGEVLDPDRGDYQFLSTNQEILEECRFLLERFPSLQVQFFDAKAPVAIAAPMARHDLVIVTGTFSEHEIAETAIRTARSRLAENGLLLFLGLHPTRWIDFTLGSNPAWWTAPAGSQHGSQHGSQQRPANHWQSRLEHYGFVAVERYDLFTALNSGPYLLLAQAPALVDVSAHEPASRQGNWLLVADNTGYSAAVAGALAESLLQQGAKVVRIDTVGSERFSELLAQHLPELGEVSGVVHLAGLGAIRADTLPDTFLDSQVDRCVIARDLVMACETRQIPCWLVSTGGISHLLPKQTSGEADLILPSTADAAFWGFGRTLLNEVGNEALYLIDLEPGTDAGTAATAIQRELEHPCQEQEVIFSAAGGRYVPRLGLASAPGESAGISGDGQPGFFRLGFHTPGQLRNLRWEFHPESLPAADEVEVEVKATGLNFRDFMYTLGLLSDEAVESGFVGPTLGLEFAGTVVRTGDAAKNFKVGDAVMGFGPACFGTKVTTKASAIAPLPPDLSFAAAATIPTAFFTVYYAMHHLARLGKGEKILIHGAAGGVGIAAIQVARWCGAEIYATAGTDEKRDFLRLLGVEHIYDSRSLDFAEEILAQTEGKGIDVVLNSLSGEAINRNLRILKPFGRFLELGKRDFYENTRLGLRPFRNNISYFGIDADQLMKDRPELTTQLFGEILELFKDGIFHPLPYTAFDANAIVDAFRHMQQSRQIGKIVVTYRNGINAPRRGKIPAATGLALPAEGTCLVVGGLNGFGLKTAEWLAEKGARNLVLISRSGPVSDEAVRIIAHLEQSGVKVHATACDATDRDALAALLEEISRSMPPLKGVFHSAMVIEDGLIRNLDRGQIRRVMAPKILGAMHLHELTRGLPLDYFVIFSSATTLFGNPGQGNYVAANSWLEALASRRQALGLPVTCVSLGAIDDAGYLSRNVQTKETLQHLMGGEALSSATVLAVLEQMMCMNVSGLGVLELDWKSLQRFLPRAGTPKFADLARLAGDGGTRQDGELDLSRMFAELSEAELLAAVIALLKEDVGEVLRIAPDRIDEERPLYDLGLDSLMGVELAVAMESHFGVKLPTMVLSENPNISKLAVYFISQIKATVAGKAGGEPEVHSQVQQAASQHGVDVDQAGIERLAHQIQPSTGRMIE